MRVERRRSSYKSVIERQSNWMSSVAGSVAEDDGRGTGASMML